MLKYSAITAIILLIGAVEFSYGLMAQPFWHALVTTLDILLVLGFIANLIVSGIKNRQRWVDWLFEKKVDLLFSVLLIIMLPLARLAGFFVIARLCSIGFIRLIDTPVGKRLVKNLNFRPSQTLALSFIGLILIGSILLTLPAATVDGEGAAFLDALFTITSAACVTGLSVQNIGTYYSLFGQGVILLTIQAGGLGIMVLSATFAVLVGGRLPSRRQQIGLGEILDVSTTEGLKSLIKAIATITVIGEIIGAVALFVVWWDDIPSFGDRLWWSLFHAVSGFNNAGFSLAPDSLNRWVSDVPVCMVFVFLMTVGGLGFAVIADLADRRVWSVPKPRAIWSRLQLQTKIVLLATFGLDALGMIIFLFTEYDGVLRDLSPIAKLNAALFQAVSLRTCGLSTIPFGQIAAPTILFGVVWMFIGGAPGSTSGGIKTTTAAVGFMTFRAMLRGRDDVELLGRKVPAVVVSRSLGITFISAFVVIAGWMFLLATQDLPFDRLLFETVSAFGTVGFSMDITNKLDAIGKVAVILLTYIGRIGPLTMALAVGEREPGGKYRFPEGRIPVG